MWNVLGSIQLLSGFGFSSSTFNQSYDDHPVVTVQDGTLIGIRDTRYDQDLFLGIPYAQPSVGNLRLNRSPLNEKWHERSAKSYGPWCYSIPQSFPGFNQNSFAHDESEDCLTLNVVRPVGVPSITGLPVLAWIHGDGFQEDESADQRYNMSFIVQESVKMGKPLIAASFNYRLGGFGFLPGTSVNKSRVANLGLHDQRMALRLIQENIAAFGGDASRVTVQGQSAGAFSIGVHYLTNGEQDEELFHAAIAESGGPVLGTPLTCYQQQKELHP